MPANFAKKAVNTLALLATLATATSALAHAHLTGSNPAADSTVSAPKELSLKFSEGVEDKFTKVTLTVDGATVAVKGIATAPGDQKTLIVTPEKPLAAGHYQLEWHAVSVDTHKSDGQYSFIVGH